jgi:amino-acid N-acetyltransferase
MIRHARSEERANVLTLLARAGLPVEGVDEHFASFFVADDGRNVVGAAGMELRGEHALLRSVVVLDEARGVGFGSCLARRVIDDAHARGVRAVYLLTTTAEGFFVRLGFERILRDDVPLPVQESAEFRGACPASAIAMRRVLDAPAGTMSRSCRG